MAKTKVLITGGTGFVGSHLTELLLKDPDLDIYVTAYGTTTEDALFDLPKENIKQLDLTNQEATHQLLLELQPDQIYHLAAVADAGGSFAQPTQVITTNTSIQANILTGLLAHSIKAKVLAVTSGLIYKPSNQAVTETAPFGPLSPYGVSKATQDLLCQAYSHRSELEIIIARPFNHTGERQQPQFVTPAFAQQIVAIERGQQSQLEVGNLAAVRDFTDVKDIVRGYQLLMNEGVSGEMYNLGSGTGTTIQDVLQLLVSKAETDIKIVTDPSRLRPSEVPYSVADSTKIKALGWQPSIPLEETVTRVLSYWRSKS